MRQKTIKTITALTALTLAIAAAGQTKEAASQNGTQTYSQKARIDGTQAYSQKIRIDTLQDGTLAYSRTVIDSSAMVKEFRTPPKAARPQVWWHWMDGNVSKEGIRKDLEWMKRSGFGGFHQFDAGGVNMPRAAKVRLPYLSESWKEAFRYAIRLADSLGLDATIASAPGWSSTGGTWVKPEDAVKKLDWTTVDVRGGKVSVELPAPGGTVGPYLDYPNTNDRLEVKPYGKDLYVLAVRLPNADKPMEALTESLEVSDTLITAVFRSPQTIKAFTLKSLATGGRPKFGEPVCRAVLECSDDGEAWREVTRIEPSTISYLTKDIRPTCARFFRIRGSRLVSMELFTVTKVNHSEELGGFGIIHDFWKYHTPYSKDAVRTSDIVNLTGKMAADGKLVCTLPPGRWRIYRFGWSVTGKINHPASPDATGLEVDKLDPDAWTRYFRTYLDLYKEAAGGMFGPKGISYLLVDSYEAGSYTWTPKMAEEFKARRGYDLIPWLPALAGEVIGSSAMTERFLWDWRRTLGELFSENYDRINDIIKEYGLAGRYTETHEGSRAYTGDGMDPKIKATIPMAAIWMENTPTGSSVAAAICDIRESASVSHIYGQPIVAAESFSVNGDDGRAYTYCPENMKFIADVGLSAGLNRFVIHESASQPNDEYLPGLQLFRYGQWLHRNETWSEYARVFTDYLARSSHLLQQGTSVADILLYYGEDINITALYGGDAYSTLPAVPDGYNYDFANPTVLRTGLKAENGCLVSPSGARYRVLWMDSAERPMSLDILKKIKEFADAGVVICSPEPQRCAGLKADDKTFASLVESIWHSGRKNVYTCPLADCLRSGGIKADFEVVSEYADAPSDIDPALAPANAPDRYGDFKYVHRTLGDSTQIYWVRNFSDKSASAHLSFRDGGRCAAVFNPDDGSVRETEVVFDGGRYKVDLPMLSTDARAVILSGRPQFTLRDSVVAVAADSTEAARIEMELGITGKELPDSLDSDVVELHVEDLSIPLDQVWDVHFEQKNGGTADERFTSLKSWTECENPVVKYFSGTAVYKTTFNVDAAFLEKSADIFINLGSVKNIAEVSVNGKAAGVLWKAPFRTGEIRRLLKEGENTLEIKVTNLWRNRMIGDVQPGEEHPVTAIRRFYKKDDTLLRSGLLGPVTLTVRQSL